jgi:hypothetical protein
MTRSRRPRVHLLAHVARARQRALADPVLAAWTRGEPALDAKTSGRTELADARESAERGARVSRGHADSRVAPLTGIAALTDAAALIAVAGAAGLPGRATGDAGRRRSAATLAGGGAGLKEADALLRAGIAAPAHARSTTHAARHTHRATGWRRVAGPVARGLGGAVRLDGGLRGAVVDRAGGRALLRLRGAREVRLK